MYRLKNWLVALTIVFVCVITVGIKNVNAQEFTEIQGDLVAGNDVVLTPDDEITYEEETWFGKDGRIAIESGDITLKYDDDNGIVNMTINGTTKINADKRFIMQFDFGTYILPVTLSVSEGSTLDVLGTLAIPSGQNSTLENNGTINVQGNLEIRDRANNYQGTGILNVYGKLAIYGTTGTNIGIGKVTIYENGNIYSEFDASTNIIIGEENSESFEITENDKYYKSTSDSVLVTDFPYGYTLKTKTTTGETEDNEEVVPPTDNTENPETSDEILLFVILGIIGMTGATITYRKLHN